MCVILVCPGNVRPNMKTLKACEAANPHGAGVAFRKNGQVEWVKTNSVKTVHELINSVEGDVVVHFRIASVGRVCDELRHPFPVTRDASLAPKGKGGAVIFQNGTWSGWENALDELRAGGKVIPAGPFSDTRVAALVVNYFGSKFLNKMGTSRWVYFDASTTEMSGQWNKSSDGIYFSNLYWKQEEKKASSSWVAKPPATSPAAPTTAACGSKGVKVACDAPGRRDRELWDLSEVDDYWTKLQRRRPSPVAKH